MNKTFIDFKTYREEIKDYFIRNSETFSDYNFEGSSLSLLIDILAYNAQQQLMYLSIATKENYLSDAFIRKNLSKLAYNIGYVPQSAKSAKLKVKFDFDFSDDPSQSNNYFIIKAGQVISANTSQINLGYSLENDYIISLNNDRKASVELELQEGFWIEEIVPITPLNPVINIVNPNIDIELLRISLIKDSMGTDNEFPCNIQYGLKELNSKYQYNCTVQEDGKGRYVLYFNELLRALDNGESENFVRARVRYLICSGSFGSLPVSYRFIGRIRKGTLNQESIIIEQDLPFIELENNVSFEIFDEAFGSSDAESDESIRLNAPKFYGAQNRAITKSDYEVIIKQLNPNIETVRVFGGEDLRRPQYGKIYVAARPKNEFFLLSPTSKLLIKDTLEEYTIAEATEVVVLDPLELKLAFEIFSYYDQDKFFGREEEYAKDIYELLYNYNFYGKNNGKYDEFNLSRLINFLHESLNSLHSVTIKTKMIREVPINIGRASAYDICFSNPIAQNIETPTITSNVFNVIEFPFPIFLEEINGNLVGYYLENNTKTLYNIYGEVDFDKGEIILNNLAIRDIPGNKLVLTAIPDKSDIFAKNNMFLSTSMDRITILASSILNNKRDLAKKKQSLPSMYR